jgi:hypothetical protein
MDEIARAAEQGEKRLRGPECPRSWDDHPLIGAWAALAVNG